MKNTWVCEDCGVEADAEVLDKCWCELETERDSDGTLTAVTHHGGGFVHRHIPYGEVVHCLPDCHCQYCETIRRHKTEGVPGVPDETS